MTEIIVLESGWCSRLRSVIVTRAVLLEMIRALVAGRDKKSGDAAARCVTSNETDKTDVILMFDISIIYLNDFITV